MSRITAFALAILLFASPALADADAKAHAKEAYARGLAAHDAGDYRAAAHAFADADTSLPSASALAAALDEAVTADDPVLGAELLDRAKRPGSTKALAQSVAAAQKRLGGRAAKLRLACPPDTACSAFVDDVPLATELWVMPGAHIVRTQVDADAQSRTLDVRAGETVAITPDKPAPVAPLPAAPPPAEPSDPSPPPPPPATRHGLPPAVVYIGGAVALVLGGGTIATGLVAQKDHADFQQDGCTRTLTDRCQTLHDRGVPLVIATDVFLATSIVAAALTTVIGIGFTDWHPSAAPTTGGFVAGLERRF